MKKNLFLFVAIAGFILSIASNVTFSEDAVDYGATAKMIRLGVPYSTSDPQSNLVLVSLTPGTYRVKVECTNKETKAVVTKDPPHSAEIARGRNFEFEVTESGCVWIWFSEGTPLIGITTTVTRVGG